MAVKRSASATQITRKISGALSTPNQGRAQQKRERFFVRCALVSGLVVAVVYLGIYLSALQTVLVQSKTQKSGQKVFNVRKDIVTNPEHDGSSQETLVLTTTIGDIRIVLRPDLSKESVTYIKDVVETDSCGRCNLYRAEKPGILQGILKSAKIPISTTKGSCPEGYANVPNECPDWDKECTCHGPVMTRGMVGWAAGQTGPDFFVDSYLRPAQWWGTQHTVWGEIQDTDSFKLIDQIWSLPTHKQGGLTHLDNPLHFEIKIE